MNKYVKIIYIFTLLFVMNSVLCASELISKLKEIDSHMYQGTIIFENNGNFPETVTITLVYDNGIYKKGIKYPDSTNRPITYYYFDGKDYFEYTGGSKTFSNALAENPNKFMILSSEPTLVYGRGLSNVKNESFDPTTNILTGEIAVHKIVAHLDPKYDYLASKVILTPNVKGPKSSITINNSNPILVDGKYYIYSNSEFNFAGTILKNKIIKATFNKPDVKDYTLTDKSPEVVDARAGVPILYSQGTIPSDMSSEELLRKTKEEAAKIAKTTTKSQQEEKSNTTKKIISIILLTTLMLTSILFIIRQLRKNKTSE